MIGSSDANDKVIVVTDASLFTVGDTIRIGQEQMEVKGLDLSNNELTVNRGTGGSPVNSHSLKIVFTSSRIMLSGGVSSP